MKERPRLDITINLDEFVALSGRKGPAFDALIHGLAPQYKPSAISDDGSQLTLAAAEVVPGQAVKAPAKIVLLAYAPSESSIVVDPCLPHQEWSGCFGLEIPAKTLLSIVNHLAS